MKFAEMKEALEESRDQSAEAWKACEELAEEVSRLKAVDYIAQAQREVGQAEARRDTAIGSFRTVVQTAVGLLGEIECLHEVGILRGAQIFCAACDIELKEEDFPSTKPYGLFNITERPMPKDGS